MRQITQEVTRVDIEVRLRTLEFRYRALLKAAAAAKAKYLALAGRPRGHGVKGRIAQTTDLEHAIRADRNAFRLALAASHVHKRLKEPGIRVAVLVRRRAILSVDASRGGCRVHGSHRRSPRAVASDTGRG